MTTFARAATLAAITAIGCTESPSTRVAAREPLAPPPSPSQVTGMRATVDLVAGTMSFTPAMPYAAPNAAPGMQPTVYGDQNVTVRIYNGAVAIVNPSRPGKKTFTGSVGVRNLLAWPIGDEQAGLAPPDTMGIYVFLNSAPTVTSTSSACPSACTVTPVNTDGALTFVSTLQRYWFYPERLSAAGGLTDTVMTRRTWTFEADTQVTRFAFTVLVSAAWAPPNGTRFKVDYQGDSLPDTQSEPKWRRLPLTGGGTSSAAAGILTISPGNASQEYYRRDSLGTAESAWIEARIKWNGVGGNQGNANEPEIVLDDGAKLIAVGIGASDVGFVDASRARIGTATATTTTAFHIYQLRKYRADSAVYYIDGVRGASLAYSLFSATPYVGTSPRVQFGQFASQNSTTSDWDYVTYELGVPLP